jgi:hypothetical protein
VTGTFKKVIRTSERDAGTDDVRLRKTRLGSRTELRMVKLVKVTSLETRMMNNCLMDPSGWTFSCQELLTGLTVVLGHFLLLD